MMHSDIMEIKTIFYLWYRNQTACVRQQDLLQSQFLRKLMRFTSIRQVCFRNLTQIHIYCARKTRTCTQPANVQISEIYLFNFIRTLFFSCYSPRSIKYGIYIYCRVRSFASFFFLCLKHIANFSFLSILYGCIPRSPRIVIILLIKFQSQARLE